MSVPTKADVVVVGGGPTGLLAACLLRSSGINVTVFDAAPGPATTSRAAIIHLRTLEVLEPLGLTDEILRLGLPIRRMDLYSHDTRLSSLEFTGLDSKFPNAVSLPQCETERLLTEKLTELGGAVYRNTSVKEVLCNDDPSSPLSKDGGVRLTVTNNATAEVTEVTAQYVVAADGMHSTVREAVDISFEGGTYDNLSFVTADVHLRPDVLPFRERRDQISLHLNPEGFLLLIPFPSQDAKRRPLWRMVATMREAPKDPSREFLEDVLRQRSPPLTSPSATAASTANAGDDGSFVTDVAWSGHFRIHHRLAARYRAGRIFLAGDAAHVHSPAGGQGMNTGLQDAAALAPLLIEALGSPQKKQQPPLAGPAERAAAAAAAAAVGGGGGGVDLDSYGAVRRPVAERVVALTHRLTLGATLMNPVLCWARDWLAWTVANFVPGAGKALARELSELDY